MSTEVDIGKTEKQEYRYLLAKKSSISIALRACGRQICFDSRKPSNLKKVGGAKLKVGGANAPPTIVSEG